MATRDGVSVETVSGVAVVKVHGPLKLGYPALDELRRHCCELGNRNVLRVLLDLEDVPSIDSSGIGVLLHGYTSMRNRGGECKLLKPGRLPLQILELVGLVKIFGVFHDRDQALASFQERLSA